MSLIWKPPPLTKLKAKRVCVFAFEVELLFGVKLCPNRSIAAEEVVADAVGAEK